MKTPPSPTPETVIEGWTVKCICGKTYSLHSHTVCPVCFRWPKPTMKTEEIRKELDD